MEGCTTQREGNRDLETALFSTLELCSRLCVYACVWGWPVLTSLQSSVDGISELSRQSTSAVSCCRILPFDMRLLSLSWCKYSNPPFTGCLSAWQVCSVVLAWWR